MYNVFFTLLASNASFVITTQVITTSEFLDGSSIVHYNYIQSVYYLSIN